MDPRYVRNVPALSEAECELLRRKRVLVVGCGGLGGHLIDMLARIGIGSLRVVDGDAFEPSNLNRCPKFPCWALGKHRPPRKESGV